MDIKKRRSDRCTRSQLRSPGRPPVAHRHERAMFWEYVAAGMSRGSSGQSWSVTTGWKPLVSGGRRYVTSGVRAFG